MWPFKIVGPLFYRGASTGLIVRSGPGTGYGSGAEMTESILYGSEN